MAEWRKMQGAETEFTTAMSGHHVELSIATSRSGLGLSNQLHEPGGGTLLPEEPEDSFEQLQADMLREAPDAVRAACDAKAEEFLTACVRYAKTMQTSENPWLGIRCLTESIIYIKDAQGRMERELTVQRKPKSTVESFRE